VLCWLADDGVTGKFACLPVTTPLYMVLQARLPVCL